MMKRNLKTYDSQWLAPEIPDIFSVLMSSIRSEPAPFTLLPNKNKQDMLSREYKAAIINTPILVDFKALSLVFSCKAENRGKRLSWKQKAIKQLLSEDMMLKKLASGYGALSCLKSRDSAPPFVNSSVPNTPS